MTEEMRAEKAKALLCDPIKCIGWRMSYSIAQQETARLALLELRRRLNEHRITKHISCCAQIKHGYLLNLYEAEKALDDCNFCLACNELLNVLYLYCSAQVIFVIRAMLDKHFGEGIL